MYFALMMIPNISSSFMIPWGNFRISFSEKNMGARSDNKMKNKNPFFLARRNFILFPLDLQIKNGSTQKNI
jgi:hypothetical protein